MSFSNAIERKQLGCNHSIHDRLSNGSPTEFVDNNKPLW
jgi:hypothetical protein